MARLPEIQTGLAATPQIQSRVSGAEVAANGAMGTLSDVAGFAGKQITDVAANYERSQAAAYIAKSSNDARNAALNIGIQANGDPEVFAHAWKAFSDQVVLKAPAKFRDVVANNLLTVGGEGYRGIVTDRHTADIASAKTTILDEIATLHDEASAIARNGGSSTPDYTTRQTKIAGLYGELSGNPAFAFPAAEAQLELRQKESQHLAEAVVGNIDRTYRNGSMADAEAEAQRLLWDPKLALSPAERRQYVGLAVDQLRTNDAERKAQLEIARAHATELKSMLTTDARLVDNSSVDRTIQNLASLGDGAGAIELMKKRAGARFLSSGSFGTANDADQVALYGRLFAPRRAGPVGGAADILRQEEGFRAQAYYDTNHFRTGYGSDTVTLADGTIKTVTKDTIVNQVDAERDLQRRIGQSTGAAAAAIGQDRWNALPDGAKSGIVSVGYNYGTVPSSVIAAAKTGDVNAIADAVASLSSNPERRQREAAIIRGGDATGQFMAMPNPPGLLEPGNVDLTRRPEVMNADGSISTVRSISFEDNGKEVLIPTVVDGRVVSDDEAIAEYFRIGQHLGIFKDAASADAYAQQLHDQQAQAIEGYDPATDPEVVKSMRAEITADAQRHWQAIQDGLKASLPPSADELNQLADQLAIVDDPELRGDVAAFLQSHADGYLVSRLSPAEGDALIAKLTANENGFSVAQMEAIGAARDARAAQATALKTDPLGYALDQQVVTQAPPAIDPSNPASVVAGLTARQHIVDVAEARYRLPPTSALRPADAQAIAAYWQTATADQRLALLSAMTKSLRSDTLLATLTDFAGKDDTAPLAIAGALAATNPAAGTAVVRGQEALKTNKNFAFDTTDKLYLGAVADNFPNTVVMPTMTKSWQMHLDAARDAYAGASMLAGDTSGKFNEERWKQSIALVTGGVLESGNGKIIAPVPGATQGQFDAVMASLPEWALSGAVTPGGAPVTAATIRRLGTLQSYGDGTYLVELGGTGAYALRAPRGSIVTVPLPSSKASPGALALAAVGGALTPMFGRPPIPADVAEMYRELADRPPTVDVQTSEGGGIGPFVLDLRPFFADGKGVYQGPAGPAPSAVSKVFQSYQQRVGAGNAALPPLAPR